jgi:hypothetical protein
MNMDQITGLQYARIFAFQTKKSIVKILVRSKTFMLGAGGGCCFFTCFKEEG